MKIEYKKIADKIVVNSLKLVGIGSFAYGMFYNKPDLVVQGVVLGGIGIYFGGRISDLNEKVSELEIKAQTGGNTQ